jgi:hypothetical protein
MRRGKKQKIGIAARMQALQEGGLGISNNGRMLKPGTAEYTKRLKQLAESISEEEFQSMISGRAGKARAVHEARGSVTDLFQSIALPGGDSIVLLKWDGQAATFCNMQRRSAGGKVIWTATPPHPLEGVWTGGLRLEGGRLIAYNFAGYSDEIDYDTGRVLKRTLVK